MNKLLQFFLLISLLGCGHSLCAQKGPTQACRSIYVSKPGNQEKCHAIIALADGRLACVGERYVPGLGWRALLLLIDPDHAGKSIEKFQEDNVHDRFLGIVENIDGHLFLIGEGGGQPRLVRYDQDGKGKKDLDASNCLGQLQGIARLGNGEIWVAAVKGGSVTNYRLEGDALVKESEVTQACENLVAMQSEPFTGGIWLCGNTSRQGDTKPGNAWAQYIDAQGNTKVYRTPSNADHYDEVKMAAVGSKGRLLFAGTTPDPYNDTGVWFGEVWPTENALKDRNPPNLLERSRGEGICQTMDGTILGYVVQTIESAPQLFSLSDKLQATPNKGIALYPISKNLEQVAMLERYDGRLIIGGNNRQKEIQIYQCLPASSPPKPAASKLAFLTPPSAQHLYKFQEQPSDYAAISCTVTNNGNGTSGQLTVFAEVLDSQLGLINVHDSLRAVQLAPLQKAGRHTVHLGFAGLLALEKAVQVKVCIIEGGGHCKVDTTILLEPPIASESIFVENLGANNSLQSDQSNKKVPINLWTRQEIGESDSLKVYYNGKETNWRPIRTGSSSYSNMHHYTYSAEVRLFKGPNHISFGFRHLPLTKIVINYQTRKPDLYVFATGVDGKGLKWAAKDAKDFEAAAKQLGGEKGFFDAVYPRLLCNPLNGDSIVANLDELTREMEKNKADSVDYFFFFYSGHGYTDINGTYIYPKSALEKEVHKMNFDNLIDNYMGKIKAQKFLFLDACRSGSVGQSAMDSRWFKVPKVSGRFLKFFSCGLGERSYELDTDSCQNGIYTYALVKALQGKAIALQNTCLQDSLGCTVNVGILQEYLQRAVPTLCKEGQKQKPTRQGTDDNNSDIPTNTPLFYLRKP